jgi:hypothetical protein
MNNLYMKNDPPPTLSKKLTSELAEYFITFFNDNKHKFDLCYIEDEPAMLSLYDLTEPTEIYERWCVTDLEYNNKIDQLLDYLQIQYTDFSSYLVTEHLPIGMHVDSEFVTYEGEEVYYSFDYNPSHDDGPGYSVIVPIDLGEQIATIVFKQWATGNNVLLEKTNNFYYNGEIAEDWSDHNNEYGLDYSDYPHVHMNTYHNEKCILDYLEVEGIIPWKKDTANAFNKKQFHTSVNFRKYGIMCKNFVLVHTSSYPYL